MKTATDGIVIWEVKTGEADRVITLLTPGGLVTAYARGSLKPGGRLTGTTAMLSYSNFELASGKNMYTVTDATSQNRFLRIYAQADRYSLAVYFCELMKYLAPTEEDSSAFLSLLLNSLYLLDEDLKPAWQIKAVFELALMTLAGYMPDVDSCSRCGSDESREGVFFDPLEAAWICSDCLSKEGRIANYQFPVIAAVRYVVHSDIRKAFSFSLSGDACRQFSRLSEDYVLAHLERKPRTLEFYNIIQ
ncbi:MAG: DNA repair protein RecO [Oscillospiraceae bacterium]|nr:DNA repair protein RecO [Oscillospiraceae bacterium]